MSGGAISGAPHAGQAPSASLWATLSSAVAVFVKSVQTAKMAHALARLPDAQLKRMGIERHEIFSHAEKLISGAKND